MTVDFYSITFSCLASSAHILLFSHATTLEIDDPTERPDPKTIDRPKQFIRMIRSDFMIDIRTHSPYILTWT